MDPLSITVGALSLAKICGTVGFELRKFISDVGNVGTVIISLQADVKDFETILELLHDTVNNADFKQWLHSSGRVEMYWESLSVSLEDARRTLDSLQETVTRINKSVGILDAVRKQMRLKFATEEVNMYQQRIVRFKDTVQIILNTTSIWHQVSDKSIPEQVVPRLDETQDMIRRLGLQFNERMASLQALIQSQATTLPSQDTRTPEKEEFKTLENLRDCLKGAASVMTSASTIVDRRVQDESTTVYGSDFGDVFPSDPSDLTLNWIRENAIQESDEGYGTNSKISHGNLSSKDNLSGLPEEQDYDEEFELEVMQAYYDRGLQCSKEKDIKEAERCFQNCIDTLGEETAFVNKSQKHVALVVDAMEELSVILLNLKKWTELQTLVKQKLRLQLRLPAPNEAVELSDKLLLAQALFDCKEYEEATLYCRSAEVGYRKRGRETVTDRADCLFLLARIYGATARVKEAEGCAMLAERLIREEDNARRVDIVRQQDRIVNVHAPHPSIWSSRPEKTSDTATAPPPHGIDKMSAHEDPRNVPKMKTKEPIAPPRRPGSENRDKVRAFSTALFQTIKAKTKM